MQSTILNFKIKPHIAEWIAKEAKKKGQTKTALITRAVMDDLMGFERTRIIGALSDFLDTALPSIASQSNVDKETLNALISELATFQKKYISQRLDVFMRYQRHLTNTAVRSYLQGDHVVEVEGLDQFIVENALQGIYDKLFFYDLISPEDFKKHNEHYEFFMEQAGKKLLKQQE